MSTPDLKLPDVNAASLPDVEELTRLANEFFRAGSDAVGLEANATSVHDAASAGQTLVSVQPTPEQIKQLTELPAALASESATLPGAEAVPSFPGVASPFTGSLPLATAPFIQGASGLSGFGFLDLIRSITPTVGAVNPNTSRGVPGFGEQINLGLSAFPTEVFDVTAVRRDFPILSERVNGRQLIWFDNAATTQKPLAVIERLSHFYAHENSNIHRAAHTLAARATDAYESARQTAARFLNASSPSEIIFVRGATEAINLVASSYGRQHVQRGDQIIVTHLEHHANIVPWQMLCAEKGATLRVAPVDNTGQIIVEEFEKLFSSATRLVAVSHVSNALGTITPVERLVEIAHRHGAKILIDGAQAVSHLAVDVQRLGCDFYVFSGHKVFGPTGIGVVYGRDQILQHTQPYQGGGNMIADVTFDKTTYQPSPARFEAGTGNIADAVGLAAALDYVQRIGLPTIARVEHDLLAYATEQIKRVPGVRLIGTAAEKASVLSFVLDSFSTEQVGQTLAKEGIAVRAGHHCAQPILRRFGVESTVRPSFAFYNTCQEIDAMIAVLMNLAHGGLRRDL